MYTEFPRLNLNELSIISTIASDFSKMTYQFRNLFDREAIAKECNLFSLHWCHTPVEYNVDSNRYEEHPSDASTIMHERSMFVNHASYRFPELYIYIVDLCFQDRKSVV